LPWQKGYISVRRASQTRWTAWCAENGDDPKLRIALCGYEGDYKLSGWTLVDGKATNAGYGGGAGNHNHLRERIWFSPHCLPEPVAAHALTALDGKQLKLPDLNRPD
jgi:hypothetical protein